MEKNIIVKDEQGYTYGTTYLRRAKGLIKNGRARFIDDRLICLACPPKPKNMEDNDMEFDNIKTSATFGEVPQLSMGYIMTRLDQVINEKQHIQDAITAVKSMELNTSVNGGFGDQARAEALGNIVQSREMTNQQIIILLNKMYDNLIGKQMQSA